MKGDTLFSLIAEHAVHHPNRPALMSASDGSCLRYGDLGGRISTLAANLITDGVTRGCRSILIMERSVELVETLLAMSYVGAECLALDCDSPSLAAFETACALISPTVVVIDASNSHRVAWKRQGQAWLDHASVSGRNAPNPYSRDVPQDATLYLNSSSGTTGASKIVAATHKQVIANARACQTSLLIEPGRTHLSTFSVHAHELFARAIVSGGTAVLAPAAQNPVALKLALERYRVNYLMTNPVMLTCFEPVLRRGDLSPNLLLVEAGGGAVSMVVKEAVAAATGARVISVWGATETGGVALAPPLARHPSGGAIGTPIAGYIVRIEDEQRQPVEAGQQGDMVIGGPAVAAGYVGQASDRLSGGWFRTGDLARVHTNGWIELRGRSSNSFKVAGSWVNAETIEKAIRDLGGAREVAVVPVHHPLFGHVPVALIEPREVEFTVDMTALSASLANPLLETPDAFVLIDQLPRVSGKVNRAELIRLATASLPPGEQPYMLRVKALLAAAPELRRRFALWQVLAHPLLHLRLLRLLTYERQLGTPRIVRAK